MHAAAGLLNDCFGFGAAPLSNAESHRQQHVLCLSGPRRHHDLRKDTDAGTALCVAMRVNEVQSAGIVAMLPESACRLGKVASGNLVTSAQVFSTCPRTNAII